MPGGDRTGPAGLGPMTGRAAGHCAGYPVAGFVNLSPRRGFWGWGRGGGRGRRRWFRGTVWPYEAPVDPTITEEQELETLKAEAEDFEGALKGIKKRIEELEAQSK